MSINAVAVYAGKKIIVAPGADVSFGKNRVADFGPAVEDLDALNEPVPAPVDIHTSLRFKKLKIKRKV